MNDNQLFQAIIHVLTVGLAAQGIAINNIQQDNQPTQQGVPTGPNLFMDKIGDHRYGWRGNKDVWDQNTESMVNTETQLYESMFQISALSIQDPTNVNQLTASDICNLAAGVMQTQQTIEYLQTIGVSIYRITDVRNPKFVDDKDRYEANPSFDFTLQHDRVIISESPVITSFVFNITPV